MTGAHGLLAAFVAAMTGGAMPPQGFVRPVLTPLPPSVDAATAAPTPLPAHEDLAARLVEPAALRDGPDGAVVGRLATRTEFGSPRVLPVVRRDGEWLGVIASERPNGALGWVRASRVRLVRERAHLEISLSRRVLRVVDEGRTTLQMTVGIGSRSTPTPTGTFAVTDSLRGWGPYGCCIVALSAHQPRLAQGWTGGDRLAVHGTPAPSTVGAATSLGCLRADGADMRRLLRVARLGMRVEIAR